MCADIIRARGFTMKAAQIYSYGDISNVQVHEVPKPTPAPGQVLVRIQAAAVNPLDLLNLSEAVKLIQDYSMPLFKRALFALAGDKLDRMARKQGKEYRFMFVRADGSQLRRVSKIVERRKLRPVIDSRCFALDDVRDALELVAAGHPEGKVVIRME